MKKENQLLKENDQAPLDRIFNARSVAIIGASKDEKKRGYQVLKALIDEKYEGKIFPVNPKEDVILGTSCYRNIRDIKQPIDIALIATPPHTILEIIEECGKAKAAGAVIIASGFGETGRKGKIAEIEIAKTAQKYNLRIIGRHDKSVKSNEPGGNQRCAKRKHCPADTERKYCAASYNRSQTQKPGRIFILCGNWKRSGYAVS
jgi:acetyltransferase